MVAIRRFLLGSGGGDTLRPAEVPSLLRCLIVIEVEDLILGGDRPPAKSRNNAATSSTKDFPVLGSTESARELIHFTKTRSTKTVHARWLKNVKEAPRARGRMATFVPKGRMRLFAPIS